MPRVAPLSDPASRAPAPGPARRGRVAARLGLAGLGLIAGLGGPAAALEAAGAPGTASDPASAAAPVLAVAPPWIDLDAAIARAGGRAVSPAPAPMAALAVGPGPDFARRLKAAGAWMVLDGRRLADLCGVSG